MNDPSRRCLAPLLALTVGMSLSCRVGLCLEEAEPGDRYRVTLLEPYDENASVRYDDSTEGGSAGATRCGAFDGLVAGLTFEMQIDPERAIEKELAYCDVPRASVDGIPTVVRGAPTGRAPWFGSDAATLAASRVEATVAGSCRGVWHLAVRVTGFPSEYLDGPTPGQYPPVVVERSFVPDDPASCPPAVTALPVDAYCHDVLVAQLEKLRE